MPKRIVTLLIGAAVLLAASLAADRNRPRLPQWAADLISEHFKDAQIIRTEREGDDDDDEERYEVGLKRANGRQLTVDLTADSGIVDIDEELDEGQIPEKVARALQKAFPKADVQRAEKRTDIRVSYSVRVVSEGRKREVRISPRGKILEVEKRD